MLGFVEQPRGCVRLKPQVYERTLYSSCINASRGIYYYTTYENRRICAVDMKKENLDSKLLISYPLLKNQDMLLQNGG
jgi:choloylglycine hydrolase